MCSDARALAVDDVRLDAIESVVVETIRASDGECVVACAVIDSASPLADFGRAIEAERFPEFDMAKAMEPFEPASIFLYTVDVEKGRIGHVERLVQGCTAEEYAGTGRTRLEVLDDRLDATEPAERATVQDLLDEFRITDPATVWNIATSCSTERVAPSRSRPYSLLTVKGLLTLAEPMLVRHCVAYVNQKTVRSMSRLGIPWQLLGGKEFHLPTGHGSYAEDFVAIHMESDQATLDAFWRENPEYPLSKYVAATDLRVVVFADDTNQVIDLREEDLTPNVELVRPLQVQAAGAPDGGAAVLDLTGDDDEAVIDLTDSATAKTRSQQP